MKTQVEWINKIGLYKIIFRNKVYVGSSVDLYYRLALHISHLKRNKHHSRYMQRCYNKYGEKEFKIEIVKIYESITLEDLRNEELLLIQSENSVFNSTTPITYQHSKEMGKQISETLKRKYKSGEIISAKLGTGKKVKIYDIFGNLLHSNLRKEEAVSILGISNRSVIDNGLREGKPYFKYRSFIVIPQEEELVEYITNYINKSDLRTGKVPIYKIDKFGNITRLLANLHRFTYRIFESKDMFYFSEKYESIYTFCGLINNAVQIRNYLKDNGAKTVESSTSKG